MIFRGPKDCLSLPNYLFLVNLGPPTMVAVVPDFKDCATWYGYKFGHQIALDKPSSHHQLLLSWYLHQP